MKTQNLFRAAILTLLIIPFCIWSTAQETRALDFTVDSTADTSDANLADDICDADPGAPVVCTLRAAIEEINDTAQGANTISFSTTSTITLGSALDPITSTTEINGPGFGPTSGGGASETVISRTTSALIDGDGFDVFTFQGSGADDSEINNIAIIDYDRGVIVDGADDVVILFVFFAEHGDGVTTSALGGNVSIDVINGAERTLIGALEGGNLIGNNGVAGIRIGNVGAAPTGTVVDHNVIGLERDMATALGNTIGIEIVDGTNTVITDNRIASNSSSGIEQQAGSGTWIWGNIIGLAIGNVASGNNGDGVDLTSTGTGNIIGTDGNGTNDANERNTISSNGANGITAHSTVSNSITIAGNYIGTTAGSLDRGNTANGIGTEGPENGTIGGDIDAETNYVVANSSRGILLDSSVGWTVRNNDVGLRPDGACPANGIGNLVRGIQIGSLVLTANNVIRDNYVGCHPNNNAVGYENAGDHTNGDFTTNFFFTGNTIGANRSHVLRPNRVGLSLDVVGDINIGGPNTADRNFLVGSTIDHHVHPTVPNTSSIQYRNNVFGATSNGTIIPNTEANLSVRTSNVWVRDNVFHEPSGGVLAPYIEVMLEGATAQNNNLISNSFTGSGSVTGGLLIDLGGITGGDGPTTNNGLYTEANVAQQGIDTVTFSGTSLPYNAITGTMPAATTGSGYTLQFYNVTSDTGIGLPGGTASPLSGGSFNITGTSFSIDLTGLVSPGALISAVLMDSATGDTSEFPAVITVTDISSPAPTTDGPGRGLPALITRDQTATIGEEFLLVQGVDVAESHPTIHRLRFTSLDNPPVEIYDESGILATLSQFFRAAQHALATIIGSTQTSFDGPGSDQYFIPPQAGEYRFQVNADHERTLQTEARFTVTVPESQIIHGSAPNCNNYQAQTNYLNTINNIETGIPELQNMIDNLATQVTATIDSSCLASNNTGGGNDNRGSGDANCRDADEGIDAYYQKVKTGFTHQLQPANFDSIFPDTAENADVRIIVNSFLNTLETDEERLSSIYEETVDAACYFYTYYDFPGILRFGEYGFNNALMIYQIRDIISGLIRDQLLGSYLNLVRTHAIIATNRTYHDPKGIFHILIPENNYSVNFVDVKDSDPHKSTYEKVVTGYTGQQALTALQLDFVSEADKAFLMGRIEELRNSKPTDRYLLPSSEITAIDFFSTLDSIIGLSFLFEELNEDLPLWKIYDTKGYQKILSPLYDLGIVNDLRSLGKGIGRDRAFTIFYRLQQLNHMLRDEFDGFGFEVRDGKIYQGGDQLNQVQARKRFMKKLMEKHGSIYGVRRELSKRVETVVNDYWNGWTEFIEDELEPMPDVSRIIFSSKDPAVILRGLKDLLGEDDLHELIE